MWFPDMAVFMFLNYNQDVLKNGINTVTAKVGTYAENVFCTEVLAYESEQAFRKFGMINDDNWEDILKFSKARTKIGCDFVNFPFKSFSQIGLQMLICVRDPSSDKYRIVFSRKTTKDPVPSEIYQCVPEAGFNVAPMNHSGNYSKEEIEGSFHIGGSLFRKFLTDAIGASEISSNSSVGDILQDPHVIRIERMLQNSSARFYFLGDCMDILHMRHELSFVLFIDDPEEFPYEFEGASMVKKDRLITDFSIDDLAEHPEIVENFHGCSVGMMKLVQDLGIQ